MPAVNSNKSEELKPVEEIKPVAQAEDEKDTKIEEDEDGLVIVKSKKQKQVSTFNFDAPVRGGMYIKDNVLVNARGFAIKKDGSLVNPEQAYEGIY